MERYGIETFYSHAAYFFGDNKTIRRILDKKMHRNIGYLIDTVDLSKGSWYAAENTWVLPPYEVDSRPRHQ
jgi:hypothetical protein